MKTITNASIALLLLLAFSVSAQPTQEYDFLKGSTLISMKGTGYIYEVDFRGTQYDFIVTLNENSAEKGMEFDYKMTNSGNTSGTVKISADAKQSAHAQNNYFSGGEMNLTDMTTVWISKQAYDELANNGETKISTDGGANWVVLKRKYYNYDFPVKTKAGMTNDLGYMYCETDDGSAKYWIQTGGNPLILKMDLGWSITLKEFKMAGE
jgi:hypothetical protein